MKKILILFPFLVLIAYFHQKQPTNLAYACGSKQEKKDGPTTLLYNIGPESTVTYTDGYTESVRRITIKSSSMKRGQNLPERSVYDNDGLLVSSILISKLSNSNKPNNINRQLETSELELLKKSIAKFKDFFNDNRDYVLSEYVRSFSYSTWTYDQEGNAVYKPFDDHTTQSFENFIRPLKSRRQKVEEETPEYRSINQLIQFYETKFENRNKPSIDSRSPLTIQFLKKKKNLAQNFYQETDNTLWQISEMLKQPEKYSPFQIRAAFSKVKQGLSGLYYTPIYYDDSDEVLLTKLGSTHDFSINERAKNDIFPTPKLNLITTRCINLNRERVGFEVEPPPGNVNRNEKKGSGNGTQ